MRSDRDTFVGRCVVAAGVLLLLVSTLLVLTALALSHLMDVSVEKAIMTCGFKPSFFVARVVSGLVVGVVAIVLGMGFLHNAKWARSALKWSAGALLAYFAYSIAATIVLVCGHPPHGRHVVFLLSSLFSGIAWSIGLVMLLLYLSRPIVGVQDELTQPTV